MSRMNYDEFAFFNQQLAAMLREGLPLEGAVKELSAGMRQGALRRELEALEADLVKGTPLKEALARRQLPEFYRGMVQIGVRGNDLPGVLTLVADHYRRANTLWARFKGLMTYPLLVILVALGLTLLVSLAFGRSVRIFVGIFGEFGNGPTSLLPWLWVPPILLGILAVAGLLGISVPSWRNRLRWRLPAFREASLAQLASAMALMLKNGTTLAEALLLAESLESNTPAGPALSQWRSEVEAGRGKPAQWSVRGPFPPLFLWLVQKGGEDPAAGFEKAAEIYQGRATYRLELALYGALPISVLLLGIMVLTQAAPLVQTLVWFMNAVASPGGFIGE
jgi:type II secretory pathway component PulF